MALTYDFDIFNVVPEEINADPELGAFLRSAGINRSDETWQVALFRDPKTADALRDAPESLRNYFLESGFGLNTYDSGAPSGRYPEVDEAARMEIIDRLTQNVRRFDLPPDEGVSGDIFSLSGFLEALAAARPDVDEVTGPDEPNVAVDAISMPIPKIGEPPSSDESEGGSLLVAMTSRLLRGMPFLAQIRRSGAAH